MEVKELHEKAQTEHRDGEAELERVTGLTLWKLREKEEEDGKKVREELGFRR